MPEGLDDPTVVIGVGSPLMGDDGLGIAALEIIREGWSFEPSVDLFDGGTWGMNLLPFIERAGRVMIIDAINIGAEPGSVVILEREALPRFLSTKVSPHQIDLREVLAVAELRGTLPEETVAIGLQPERIELSTDLSPEVEAQLPLLVERIIERVVAWGHAAHRIAGAHA